MYDRRMAAIDLPGLTLPWSNTIDDVQQKKQQQARRGLIERRRCPEYHYYYSLQSRASLTSVGRKNINLFGQSSAIKIATTSEQSPSICQFFPAAIR